MDPKKHIGKPCRKCGKPVKFPFSIFKNGYRVCGKCHDAWLEKLIGPKPSTL